MEKDLKDILLKDLCARLPYGVKVLVDNKHWCDFNGRTPSKITFDNSYRLLFLGTKLGYVKPYLFPLSSMTEEQSKIYHELISGMFGTSALINFEVLEEFFNKNHLDYRGLIPMGLALDATGLNIY